MRTISALALLALPLGFFIASASAREARFRQMKAEIAPRLRELAIA